MFSNFIKKYWLQLVFFLFHIFFFFLLGETVVAYSNDSLGYLTITYAREPVYPLLIQFFLKIFGENNYLMALTFFQGFLAIACLYYTVFSLQKIFLLRHWELFLVNGLLLLPYGIDTLWDAPRVVYTHFIMTEGITYSLFYVFFILLLSSVLEKKYKKLILATLLALLLALLRGQMMICFPALFIGLFLISYKEMKRMIAYGIVIVCSFLCISLLTKCYHLYFHDIFASPMENSLTVFSNVLYASDREDVSLISSKEEADFFLTVFDESYARGYQYTFAKEGMIENGKHLMDSHDKIKYDILRGKLYEYTDTLGLERDYRSEQTKKALLDHLTGILRKDNLNQWIYNCISLIPMALLLSFNPITPPALLWLCYLYAFSITLFSITILLYRMIKEKQITKGTLFLGASLSLILINVCGLSISIYGISRYTNYTMGLFYISLYFFLKEWLLTHFNH